jgi:hypothetical protein
MAYVKSFYGKFLERHQTSTGSVYSLKRWGCWDMARLLHLTPTGALSLRALVCQL